MTLLLQYFTTHSLHCYWSNNKRIMNLFRVRQAFTGAGRNSDSQFAKKVFRPLKLDRNMTHIIKKKESQLKSRQTKLAPNIESYEISISPDPSLQEQYCLIPSNDVEIQEVPSMSYHDINTETIDFASTGMNHVEGGWPKDVSSSEGDQKLRYRKKIEKDEYFIHTLLQLGARVEHCIKQNNALDIYEDYFVDDVCPIVENLDLVKTINVIHDVHPGRMITDLSFSPTTSKVAASYSSTNFLGPSADTDKQSFVWDINASSSPTCTLRGPSWAQCLQYNQKDQFIVAAGCRNGQVCYWDVRSSSRPVQITPLTDGHTDVVTSLSWLLHKTRFEMFTISIDGQVLWWDSRNLSKCTDRIELIEKEDESLLTATCLEHDPSMPTKFMVGTEQGKVAACNRRARNPADRIGICYPAHLSPIYSVQRNPMFLKNFLTIGDWTAKIWTEDFKESPILWTVPSSAQLRTGCWSPTRASVFVTAATNGAVQIWDLLQSWQAPTGKVQVADEALESLQIHETGRLMVTGSAEGTLTVLQVPESLAAALNRHEKAAFTSLLERETRRERVLEARHKEQRLRDKAKSAPQILRREQLEAQDDPVAIAEREYLAAVEQLKAQLECEEAAIVEVTPAPEDYEATENGSNLSPGHLDATDSDDPRSYSSGEPER